MVPFIPIARCGVQWYSYFPGGTLPNEIVYVSFGFIIIGLESSETCCCMLADSCDFASAGICAGSKATLCGPPETMMNLTPSPGLMVTSAGSKRNVPLSSCSIFTSTVCPVIGAADPPLGLAEVVAFAGLGVEAVAAESIVLFFSPPQAASRLRAVNAVNFQTRMPDDLVREPAN